MQEKSCFSKQELSTKIHNLRLKLNSTYEKHGLTEEVVKISQELDKYIILEQQQLIKK